MSAINIQELLEQPSYRKSDIQFCEVEPPYWLSLYQDGGLFSTTGQTSYIEAIKHALLWISIKSADRHYKIMHESDGFQIEETAHVITQKCQHSDCQFISRHSSYVADGERLQRERLTHLARYNRIGQVNLKLIFAGMAIALISIILSILKGWL